MQTFWYKIAAFVTFHFCFSVTEVGWLSKHNSRVNYESSTDIHRHVFVRIAVLYNMHWSLGIHIAKLV